MIVVAEDLAPSETVQMDKSKVLAFVTRKGSSNSHTAILARTMNIPALINIEYDESMDGKMAVVDGKSGNLIVDPDAETLKKYEDLRADELAQRAMLKELKGKETVTKSGRKLHLYANIGSTGDVPMYLPMMQRVSDFSEVSLYIWKKKITLQRKSSSRFIRL